MTARANNPIDALIPDPSDKRPLCDEPRFAAILQSMVTDQAPRIFAVVQEYGERVDAHIAAWGIAFTDRAEVVSTDPGLRLSLETPECALHAFSWGNHIRARLVWPEQESSEDQATTETRR